MPVRSTNVRNTGTSRGVHPSPATTSGRCDLASSPATSARDADDPPAGFPCGHPAAPGPVAGQIAWEGDVDGSGGRGGRHRGGLPHGLDRLTAVEGDAPLAQAAEE